MNDLADDFKALKKHRQNNAQGRRRRADHDFQEASALALQLGMKLVQRSEQHYQLRSYKPLWLLDVYPGNQRLFRPTPSKNAVPVPFLDLSDDDWTLRDVVNAAKGEQPC